MPFKKFIKIITKSSEVGRLQDNIQDSLQPIVENTLLDSQKLSNISLTQGIVNNIPHKLNRVPNGWKTLNQYAQADLWNAKASDNNYIYLVCSSDVVVDLEVS